MRSAWGDRFAVRCWVLLAVCFPSLLHAQLTKPESAADAALRKPTDFRSRVELRNEYQDLPGGGYRNLVIPRFEYAVTPRVALRLETPYISHDTGPDDVDKGGGFGDLLVRAAWRAVQRDGFALVLVTEAIFDTAADERLGQGKTVIAPLVFAAIDLPRFDATFFPNVQHYASVGGDSQRANVSFTTIKPNLLKRWPNRTYTFVEPQFTIDWERDARVGLTLEVEFGKLIGKNVGIWARPGVGLLHNDLPQVYNWNFEVGVRYTF